MLEKPSKELKSPQESPINKEISEGLNRLTELSEDGILIFANNLQLCYKNKVSSKILNIHNNELAVGKSLKELRNISSIFDPISNLVFQVKTQKKKSATISIPNTDLGIRCFTFDDSIFGNGCFEVIIFDATDFLANQKAANKAEKVNAFTHFTNNIAHEINNPLTGINNALYLLKAGKLTPEKQNTLLEKVSENITRIAKIVEDLRKYSHQGASSENIINITEVIQDTICKAIETTQHSKIDIEYSLPDSKIEVLGNIGEFRQMLFNIVLNAIQAMPNGGKLSAIVDTVLDTEKRMARIQIVDTGCGMASEEIEYAFNPLYTQKKIWNNIGLGLSVAHRIALYMHGDIQIKSKKEKGTTVIITIPAI